MGYRDLNNRGLHAMRMQQFMQEGGQPQMAPQMTPQAKSPMDDLIPAIKAALEQGAPLPQIIVSLAQNQVPIEAIQEALMSAGIPQEEIVQAFQMIEQQQAQAQAEVEQMEGPVESNAQPQEAAPAPEMAPEEAQMPMAQEGQEVDFAQQGQNNVGPSINSDIPEYQEPIEEIISERLDEDGKVIKDNYEYKKTTDPNTGQVFYETRKKGAPEWKDAGEEGSTSYRAITDIFGDDTTGYKDSPERANWINFLQDERQKNITSDQLAKAKKQGIDFSKYGVRVINYPYGYQDMEPGHIEAVFYDKETGQPKNEIGGIPTRINRWSADRTGRTGDEGFTQMEVNFDALGQPGVRSADLDLTPEQMMHFIAEANKFKGTSYKNLNESQRNFLNMINPNIKEIPTALVTGSDDNYDFLNANCADGICRGLDLDRDQFVSAGITNPEKVMDYILQGDNVIAQRGKKGPSREEFLKSMIDKSGINKYTFGGLSDENIAELANFADNISREDAQKLATLAPVTVDYAKKTGEVLDRGIDLDQSIGDMAKNTAKYWADLTRNAAMTGASGWMAIPDGTIPTVVNAATREYIAEPVMDAAEKTVKYLQRNGLLWPFEQGGQPGKYSSIINNNKMKYSNLFKNGGGYDNPGFKSLPQYVQNKIKRNAQDGTELADATPVDATPVNMSAEEKAYMDAKAAYDAEMARVMNVRNKTAELARQYGDSEASYSDVGISDRLANWVNENGFACNTYSCQIMRNAGATIPQGTEPFEMNNRIYRPGDKLPIIPGNAQFNDYADKLGFELMPKGTLPTEAGDLVRGHMYNAGPNASSGSYHSVLSAGYGDDDVIDLYNNPGGVYSGYKKSGFEADNPDFYTNDSGVMRYVGDSIRLKEAMDKAKQAYDATLNETMVDANPQSTANVTMQYGGERNWAEIQQADQGTPSTEELMAIIQKQQMQMQQMQMQMQQMMQMQQAGEEVETAEAAMLPTYRTNSLQKKSGGTVELDTETIAKIMAAGGSVKFS